MRRIVLTYIFLSVIGIWGAMAQNTLNPMNNRDRFGNQIDPNTQPDNLEDSTNTEIQSLPPKLYMWKLSETLGNRTIIPADTASLNFQSTNLVEGMFGHYNYLGNLGSPRLSRLFFEREESEPTIFMAPFSSFFTRPDQVLFTNSNVPYTNLTYYKAGSKVNGEERFKSYFSVNANLDLNFRLWKDTVNFYARGYVSNTLPSFYMRHYHSNHYNWDNDNMDKEFRTRVEGELNISRWGTNLRAGVENIKNYTYFNQSALPEQNGGNIQVLSATLKQDFPLGVFHLDNEVTWQKTSNETVLPLPQLSLYHNFYILAKLAKKVLTVQLGADVRYFTKYNAPAYAPGVQQFHLQPTDDLVEIGGYPIVNVYANLHLKRTRIFAMMYHVNAGMGSANSFLVPHYPINPRLFKIGVSWNFYD